MKSSTLKGLAGSIVFLLGVVILNAVVPDWWTEQNVAPDTVDQTDPQVIQGNYKPALIGQAKHMAYQVYQAMEAKQACSAGSTIENMVMNFSTDSADNYAPLLIGQLKAIAQPFYDRFSELGYDVGDISLNSSGYPWGENTPIDENYKPANLGQLKYVFSFDLSTWTFPNDIDEDGDGLSDYWECQIIKADPSDAFVTIEDVLPNDDFDGDGINNYLEINHLSLGLDPLDPDSNNNGIIDGLEDTDSDLIPDYFEIIITMTDPLVFDEFGDDDMDGDGLSTAVEASIGSNIFDFDSNGDGISDGVTHALGLDPSALDPDGDGLSTEQEQLLGASTVNSDTDGDGSSDSIDPNPLDPDVFLISTGVDTVAPIITLIIPVPN